MLSTLGEHDWYKVSLAAGQTITVTLTGGGNLDTYLNIYNPAGSAILASNDDISTGTITNSRLTFTAPSAGTYFIDVGSYQNQTTGTYDLYVEPSPPPVFTYDQIAFQLTSGYWGGDVHHWNVSQGGTLSVNISTLTAGEQTLARAALQEWSDIIGVHFQEVSSGGQIVFSDAEDTTAKGPVAQTDANWTSNGIITSANVHISQSWVTNYGTTLDSYSFQTYVHEIGHALGLGHAGQYNDSATYSTDALFANDSWSTSIMSYFDQSENSYFSDQGFSRLYALTPMDADIVAMQSLYGLSTTTRPGDTTYGDNSNAGGIYDASQHPRAAFAIFDSGGNNTIDYSGSSANQLINLNPGTFSNVNGYTGNLTIAPGTLIQNAIGGSGNDVLIGNSANNVLTGGSGTDTLTGGGGNDTFKDTVAGHNGDTITDFHPGDLILFTNASLSGFTFSLSGNTLTYSGGSMTLDGTVKGTFSAVAAASGGVQLSEALPHIVHDDFNGDGHSDILWRNTSTGQLSDWLSNSTGGFVANDAHALTSVSPDWQIVGTGDFNGDRISDILWRNSTTGAISDWLGNSSGGFVANDAHAAATVPTGWQVVGTGDFNGDGFTDILWRNGTTGVLSDWLGNSSGGFAVNDAHAATTVPTDWHVVGTGDFNGDGLSDILWRNASTGQLSDWLGMANGGFLVNDAHAAATAPTSWVVAGTGDFNGDGITDILWRNSATGEISDWLGTTTGGFLVNDAHAAATVPTDWTVAATGDFNGDGISDVLWRNTTTGAVSDWLGNSSGGFVNNDAHAATFASTSWQVESSLFG